MKQQKVEKMNNNQVILYELDNQNKDSANFENSEIKTLYNLDYLDSVLAKYY